MAEAPRHRTNVRVEVSGGSVALVLLAIATAFLAARIAVDAQRILSWAVACAVVAALMELMVGFFDRWMRRPIAILLVLLLLAGAVGALSFLVFKDLDSEINRFHQAAPAAARQLERSKHAGNLAREIDLDQRVRAAVDRLSAPSSGLAGEAVSTVPTYAICMVLTVLFLSWGPRVTAGAIAQLQPAQARRWRIVIRLAFMRARAYVVLALGQSAAVGLVTWFACRHADVPAPAPLALAMAAFALLPNIGILVGSLPILLLAAGLRDPDDAFELVLLFVALQVVSSVLVQPRIVRLSRLYVGPAVLAIAGLVGFELYGIGGALYAAALAIMGVAAIDASAETDRLAGMSETDRMLTKP